VEQASLFRELRKLMAEDAKRRQEATRFGAQGAEGDSGGVNGAAAAAAPQRGRGDSRRQAAEAVTGKASYSVLEQISAIERVAADRSVPGTVRKLAEAELADIQGGADVKPAYHRVLAAVDLIPADQTPIRTGPVTDAELDALSAGAMQRVRQNRPRGGLHPGKSEAGASRRSLRAFLLTWGDLDGWSRYYNPTELAAQLKGSDWAMFERVLAETITFADEVRALRSGPAPV
jgi:ParB family chromosome partitioning protein